MADFNRSQKRLEVTLWSIAFPGFGQLLNAHFLKGVLFIALEFIINCNSHLNTAIVFSFHGATREAMLSTDSQWLMFYPCIYMYAVWDAYRYASDTPLTAYVCLPFVMAAYCGTVGVIYSPAVTVLNYLLGPVWLPILTMIGGILLGLVAQYWLRFRKT